MKNITPSLLLILACQFASQPLWADVTGHAHDERSTLIYSERHTFSPDLQSGAVEYFSPTGRVIAQKTLAFNDPSCPTFILNDSGGKLLYGIEQDGEIFYYRRGDDRKKADFSIQQSPQDSNTLPIVCDGGFDRFVQQLNQHDPRQVNRAFFFAYPLRLQGVQMEIKAVSIETLPAHIIEKLDSSCRCSHLVNFYRVRPTSWFFGLFAPDLYLAYSQDHRLLLYSGPSNLPQYADAGRVNIFYQYPSSIQ